MPPRICLFALALAGCHGGLELQDTSNPLTGVTIEDLRAELHPEVASIVELTWTQDLPASVHAEYSFDEGEWLSTPEYEVFAGDQRLLLLGIPYDTEVEWRLLVDGEPAQDDESLTTGPVPSGLPMATGFSGDPERWDPDVRWLLGCFASGQGGGSAWAFVFDRQGRPVWARRTPSTRTTFMAQLSADGSQILVDHNSWWGAFDGGAASQVAAWDIEGELLHTWDTPGMIHPFTQTGDGSLVWGASQGAGTDGEVLAILVPEGEPRTLFDCNAFARAHGGDYCGSNNTWWDPATGHVYFSLYSIETVIEVDPAGEPVRWFGHLDGAWAFAGQDQAFHWQHGPHLLDDGHLLLSSRRTDSAEETVVREYVLHEDTQTLEQVWTAGMGEGVYAWIMGEAHRLKGGHTLHNYGSTARIREFTPEGDVVWDLSWGTGQTLGRTQVIDDLYALWAQAPPAR